jgi:hypothetical protein
MLTFLSLFFPSAITGSLREIKGVINNIPGIGRVVWVRFC